MHTVLKIQFYVIFLSFVTQFLTMHFECLFLLYSERKKKEGKLRAGEMGWHSS